MIHRDYGREEYELGFLLDEQERVDWERSRNEALGLEAPRLSRVEMIAAVAAERAEAMAEGWDWERSDWRWKDAS